MMESVDSVVSTPSILQGGQDRRQISTKEKNATGGDACRKGAHIGPVWCHLRTFFECTISPLAQVVAYRKRVFQLEEVRNSAPGVVNLFEVEGFLDERYPQFLHRPMISGHAAMRQILGKH